MINSKQKKLIGLKKAISLAQKVQQMIEEDNYCIDIIQQVEAINGLMRGVKNEILENHLKTCFRKGMESKSEAKKQTMIDEVIKVIGLKK